MAERVGFEPTVELPPLRFSRPACSTAPAPLRKPAPNFSRKEAHNVLLFCLFDPIDEVNMKRAANVVVLENDDPLIAENEAIQEKIRYRAWELSHTRPHDVPALYDWLKAQSEIVSVPPVRVVEKEGKFEIKFAVAGVDPNDVNVMVTSSRVLLKAESAEEENSDEGTVHISDFRTATVFRAV